MLYFIIPRNLKHRTFILEICFVVRYNDQFSQILRIPNTRYEMKHKYINTFVPNISIYVYSYISISMHVRAKSYANQNTSTLITRARVMSSRFPIRINSNPTPMKHDTYAKERNKINTGRICLTFELETLSYIIPYIPYKHTRAKGSSIRSTSFF